MKKLITGLVLGASCCMLFSTPAFPTKYDPSRPPPTPTINIGTPNSNGDDTGWENPITSPGPGKDDSITIRILRFSIRPLPHFGFFLEQILNDLLMRDAGGIGTADTQNSTMTK